MKDNLAFTNYMHHIAETNQLLYHKYLSLYLNEVILMQYIKVDTAVYNCSLIDIIDPNFIQNKFALSGTVRVYIPEFEYYGDLNKLSTKIKYDNITTKRINDVLMGNNLLGEPTKTILLDTVPSPKPKNVLMDSDTVPEKIKRIIINLDPGNYNVLYRIITLMNDFDVLIDVGSFLRNFNPLEFATIMSDKFSEHTIIYYDNLDQPVAIKNNNTVQYNIKNLKHDVMVKIIFDQKHTIGTDLDLHSKSRGLVTVNNATTRSPLVQGIFRLREADLYQKITYLIKDIEQDTKTLVYNVNHREDLQFEKSKTKAYQQIILCLLRKYENFSTDSYTFNPFIPNVEMSDMIFEENSYNHNYKKEHFNKFVMKKIKGTGDQLETEILKYLKLYNDTSDDDVSAMTQKQTIIQQEKEYQLILEANTTKRRYQDETLSIKNYTYRFLLVPGHHKETNESLIFSKIIAETQIIKLIKSMKISLSPSAGNSIRELFDRGISENIFFMLFPSKISRMSKELEKPVILLTSLDVAIYHCYNHCGDQEINGYNLHMIKNFVQQNDPQSFHNNLFMFLSLKIPGTKMINWMNNNKQSVEIKEMIGQHFKNTFKYDVKSVSPHFANYLFG